MTKLASLIVMAALCAPMSYAKDASSTKSCLRESRINSFSSIDKQHVLLSAGPSQDWLVTLRNSCRGLVWDHVIAIDGDGFGCLDKFDRILVQNGSIPQSCLIETVEPVESREMARAIISERKTSGVPMPENAGS